MLKADLHMLQHSLRTLRVDIHSPKAGILTQKDTRL